MIRVRRDLIITREDLVKIGIGTNQITNARHGKDFTTNTVGKICSYLNKQPHEILEFFRTEDDFVVKEERKRQWFNSLPNKRFDKLYALLEERGISMYRLALSSGYSKDLVNRAKATEGGFSYDSAMAFTEYLECNLHDICEWDKGEEDD